MPKKRKLTYKQEMVIKDVTSKVEKGRPMKIVESVEKFYNVKNRASANQVMHKNLRSETFRASLMESLIEKNILGGDSKTEKVLLDGLEAETKEGLINYDTRLKYVQEINKISGVYAPEVKKTMSLNLDMTDEDLDAKIKELQEQMQ